MATWKPLIVNSGANQIQEIPTGDSLDGITTLSATTFVGNGIVPLGAILMWGGGNTIPSGFTLCNASNAGTVNGIVVPNLEDKFIIGAKQHSTSWKTNITGSLTASGGTKDAIVVSHTHTGDADSGGAHTHAIIKHQSTTNGGGDSGSQAAGWNYQWRTTGNPEGTAEGAHTHALSIASQGSSGTNQNLPPYVALAYIIRTS